MVALDFGIYFGRKRINRASRAASKIASTQEGTGDARDAANMQCFTISTFKVKIRAASDNQDLRLISFRNEQDSPLGRRFGTFSHRGRRGCRGLALRRSGLAFALRSGRRSMSRSRRRLLTRRCR
jgi:hypothetical protein